MKIMFKHYFTHPSVWTYICIGIALFVYLLKVDAFIHYYWVLAIPIIIAPFFEWVVHKYVLHLRIGNIVEIDKSEHPDKRVKDNVTIKTKEGDKEFKVLAVSEYKIKAGAGIAKNMPAWFLNFMEKLHYGHHKNPNNVSLIFAPIMAIVILYAFMFLVFYAISRNLDMSLTFLFSVVCYYLHYEWMHLGHHIAGYNHIMPWSKTLKKVHLFHHFKNENYWWGITNILGDIILGTYKKHEEVERSETVNDINP